VDDSNRTSRLAAHLNSKKAGPLVCPICKASESFEAKGDAAGPPSDLPAATAPLSPTDSQLSYAACTNCGYSIFFDMRGFPPPA